MKIDSDMEFYEDVKNFRPILNTAISLMRSRGQENYCQLVMQGDVSVSMTDYDNWNGGTYGYTVFIDVPVSVYAGMSRDRIADVEKELSETLNEVTKGDNNNYFSVQISPKFTSLDIDWSVIGGEKAKEQLKSDLLSIKDILISVATGGPRIQDVEDRYQKLHSSLTSKCKLLSIKYDNNFTSLWDWYCRWRDGLNTYQSRRDFIGELLRPTFEAFNDDVNRPPIDMPIVEVDEWEQIKRVLVKIKRDSGLATNEEDFQQIGLLCREVIISLAQVVYDPLIHGENDDKGTAIGKTDAVRMMLTMLQEAGTEKINILLDEPVSNSGRLKALIADIAEEEKCPFDLDVRILRDVDRTLYKKELVISSDSVILDHCSSWVNLMVECMRQRGRQGIKVW